MRPRPFKAGGFLYLRPLDGVLFLASHLSAWAGFFETNGKHCQRASAVFSTFISVSAIRGDKLKAVGGSFF